MTQFADGRDLEHWHYVLDDTHVCLYRKRTMRWIAEHYDLTLHLPRSNVTLFQKD